jgi:hypothetical protein
MNNDSEYYILNICQDGVFKAVFTKGTPESRIPTAREPVSVSYA